jgi:hypothetical protein
VANGTEPGEAEFLDTTKDRLAELGATVRARKAMDEAEEALSLLINDGDSLAIRDRALSAVGHVLDAIVIFKEYVKP